MSFIKEIPKGWEIKKLGEVCEIKNGKNQKAVVNPNGKYPIYGSAGIMGYANDFLCEEGTTIVGRKGTINKPIYVKTKFWNVDTAFGFSPAKKIIDSRFLFFFCQSFNFHKLDKSTTIPSLAKTDLQKISIAVPPLKIQQILVAKIEELLSELDNGKQQLQIAQQQLKVYRQSLLKWAFEGKLTDKKIIKGELPKGWKKVEINNLSKLINGDRGKNYPNRNEYVSKGIPFINTGHIEPNGKLDLGSMNYITPEKFNALNSGKVKVGDLIYCLRGATMGKTAIIEQFDKGAIASSLVIIRVNSDVHFKYIYYFLICPFGRDFIKKFDNGTAQPNLSAKSLSMFLVPLPSFNEQQLIVDEIESKLTVCDKIEEIISQSLQRAETLRQSVLKKAFEGKLI